MPDDETPRVTHKTKYIDTARYQEYSSTQTTPLARETEEPTTPRQSHGAHTKCLKPRITGIY